MDKIEEELLKLSLSPEEVDEPELFLERIYGVKTHEDLEVVRAMIHRRSTSGSETGLSTDFVDKPVTDAPHKRSYLPRVMSLSICPPPH